MAMWNLQMERFTASRRVLRYDSRGHGRSDAPAGDYTIGRLGLDVLELADALDVGAFEFCGLSMGGMVGQWLGVNASSRLSRVALANTAAHMGPRDAWEARISVVKAEGMAAIAPAVAERWFTPEFRGDPQRADWLIAMLLATSPHGYRGCCAAIRDMDQRSEVYRITAPTLVIGGRDDMATPTADAEFLAREIPGAALVMLNAAHLSNIEQPDAFAEAVLAHMDAR
jgi:3-oxoadipate enol-lactonase